MTGGVGGLQGSLAEYAAVDADLLAPKPKNLGDARGRGIAAGLHHRVGRAGGSGRISARAKKCWCMAAPAASDTSPCRSRAPSAPRCSQPVRRKTGRIIEQLRRHLHRLPRDAGRPTMSASIPPAAASIWSTTPSAAQRSTPRSMRSARFGHVVSALGWGTHALAPLSFRAATYSGVFTLLPMLTGEGRAHHGEILREATELCEAGKIVPRIDPRHFTLATIDRGLWRDRDPQRRRQDRRRHRGERFKSINRSSGLQRQLPDGQISRCAVQPHLKKYFFFTPDPNHRHIIAVPSHLRGGSRSSRTRGGMRWTWMYR